MAKQVSEGPSIPEVLRAAVPCSLETTMRDFDIDLDALHSMDMIIAQRARDSVVSLNYQNQSWPKSITHHRDSVATGLYRHLEICRGLILAPYQ